MRRFRLNETYIAVLFGLAVFVIGITLSVDAEAQMMSIGAWEFEQKIDGEIGSVIACRTNVPSGGDFNDNANTQPILKARAKVGESDHPFSNCSAHVTAEAELFVTQAPTMVVIECEARGNLNLDENPGTASINARAEILDPSGIATHAWTNCSPSSQRSIGNTQVIEMDRKEVCLEPGKYLIRGKLDVDAEIGIGAIFGNSDANMLDRIPSTGLHVFVEEMGGCPVLETFSSVEDFDFNNDRFIQDNEFISVLDAWINNQISDNIFFTAIDFWVNITPMPVRGASADAIQLSTTRLPNGVLFSADYDRNRLGKMTLNIMNNNGQLIHSNSTYGQLLRWNYLSTSGQIVANGVYFAQINAFDLDGKLVKSEMKKVLVIR